MDAVAELAQLVLGFVAIADRANGIERRGGVFELGGRAIAVAELRQGASRDDA